MIHYRVVDSVGDFTRDEWDALFPNRLERFDYLMAVESAGMKGFRWRYAVAEDGGRLIAAVPGFHTHYWLDTTLTGVLKRLTMVVRRWFPRALQLQLACVGSPCTETIGAGFSKRVDSGRHASLLGGMLRVFEADAGAAHCGLLALKDIPIDEEQLWRRVVCPAGYRPVPGMPVASLNVDFKCVEEYLARLSAGTRRDMRRKLRVRQRVRVERRRNIDDVLQPVADLYAATRSRAELQFEELTPAFFQGVLARVPGASCALYYIGNQLAAMNLLLEDRHMLLDKFFCMNVDVGRDFNLYFLSWFENVEHCIANGLVRYQSGQAGYENKSRLGSTLCRTSMYIRHSNALINAVLRAVAPLLTRSLQVA